MSLLPGPKNFDASTDNILEPILSGAVLLMLTMVFAVFTMLSLHATNQFTEIWNSDVEGYFRFTYGNGTKFVKFIGAVVSILIPMLAVGSYGILMNPTPYPGIVLPYDFVNIMAVCYGAMWVVLLWIVNMATHAMTTNTASNSTNRNLLRFGVYAATMLTIYLIPLIEAFGAGSYDAGFQQSIPPTMSGACLIVGFIQCMTNLVSVYQGSAACCGRPASKTRGAKLEDGTEIPSSTQLYSAGYITVRGETSVFVMYGIDIGFGEIVARVVSLPFLYLCKYNDAIKFIYSSLSIPFSAALMGALFGQQFYLPFEGMLTYWTYSINYFSTGFVNNGTNSVSGFETYNLLTVPGSKAYYRMELYQSAPGAFVLFAILAIAAQFFGFIVSGMRDKLEQERTFSSTRYEKSADI